MSDYISRQAANEALACWNISPIVIDAVPSADVVEVVRCKDCKYWLKTTLSTVDGEPVYDCPLLNEWGDEDGYCSFGEREDT